MILIIHIVIALMSLVVAGTAFFRPSRLKIQISYGFVAATLASGFYLVWLTKPAHMAQVCLTGLIYLGITLSTIGLAHRRMVKQNLDHEN